MIEWDIKYNFSILTLFFFFPKILQIPLKVKMTDSASDTSSIRNLDVGTGGSEDADNVKGELGTEDVTGKLNEKIDGTKRFYALYSVQPQR